MVGELGPGHEEEGDGVVMETFVTVSMGRYLGMVVVLVMVDIINNLYQSSRGKFFASDRYSGS